MQNISLYILDAFTEARFAGNPAGVVISAKKLTDFQMRSIAGEISLETAFVTPSLTTDVDYVVAYFTGVRRIPLCGHNTIALATVLRHLGRPPGGVRVSTDVGVLEVEILNDGLVTMAQNLLAFGPILDADACADTLGLPHSALADLPAQIVSTGTPFALLAVQTRADLDALAPDFPRLGVFLDTLGIDGIYVYTLDAAAPIFLHARCFCPAAGLPEDPVTGTASGAVGAFLCRQKILTPDENGKIEFVTRQGEKMERVGNVGVKVRVENGEIAAVQVTGKAVLVAEGTLFLE